MKSPKPRAVRSSRMARYAGEALAGSAMNARTWSTVSEYAARRFSKTSGFSRSILSTRAGSGNPPLARMPSVAADSDGAAVASLDSTDMATEMAIGASSATESARRARLSVRDMGNPL